MSWLRRHEFWANQGRVGGMWAGATLTVLAEELGGAARAELWPKLVAEWPKPVAGSPDLGAA